MRRRIAQRSKPFQVRAGHCAFTVHVGAEESGAERFELRHYSFGPKSDSLSPAVNGDSPTRCVECDHDSLAGDSSNAAADTNLHRKILPGFRAEASDEIIIRAFSNGCIQVNHVQPEILLEFLE